MKYCIGCSHWRVSAHQKGEVYSEETADFDTPASLSCSLGHWRAEIEESQDDIRPIIEKCMEKAETCPDFKERILNF